MADWYTAAQVTVNNGETIVRVVSAEPIDAIRPHDSLLIGSFTGRDILQVYTESITLDQIIELVRPWDEVTQTLQPARVQPTSVNFNVAADALTTTNNKIASNFMSLSAFGTQASGTVTFTAISLLDQDVTIRSIPQYKIDLDALELQAQDSVDDVTAIDNIVNGVGGLVEVTAQATADLAVIDGTLTGYVNTTKSYRDSALSYRDTTLTYKDTTYGYMNTTLGYRDAVSTWHGQVDTWQGQALSYKNLAFQYRNEAEVFKNEAEAIVGLDFVTKITTVNGKPLATSIVLNAIDVGADTKPYVTFRDFTIGTLIKTSFTAGVWSATIRGNGYGSKLPIDLDLQGYIYGGLVGYNGGGLSKGFKITGLRVFLLDGKLCIWFPTQMYWQGFEVTVVNAYAERDNKVIDVTDEAKPTVGVTQETDYATLIKQVYSEAYKPTKSDIGLSDVDNTSDANKPLSTATKDLFRAASTGGSGNWNDYSEVGVNAELLLGTDANGMGGNSYYYCMVVKYGTTGNLTQLAIPYDVGTIHTRYLYGGTWSGWSAYYSATNKPTIVAVTGLQEKLDEIELFALAGL